MPITEVLKKFRGSDYGANKEALDKPEEETDDAPETVRTIKLTDEEAKALQPSGVHPGEEITLEISGKLEEDGRFQVMSVQAAAPDGMEEEDVAKVAGVPPPITPMP